MNIHRSQGSSFNHDEPDDYDDIDKYLDGALSEQEMEDFESRCFSDDALLLEVQDRMAFRKQVTYVIKKNAREIFSEELYLELADLIIKKSTLEFTKDIITNIVPQDLPLFDHFTRRYFEEDPEERSALVLEPEFRSAAGEAAPKVNLTYFILLVVESVLQSVREKSPEKLQAITTENMKEFLQQHARELLEQYRELTKSYSTEILQQVEKFGDYLKKLLAR